MLGTGSHLAGLVPPAGANAVSIVACIWLAFQVSRLPRSIRRRLFPRQILTLALSDILFHLLSLCRNILDFGQSWQRLPAWACPRFMPLVFFATDASALSAVHLALVFLFQAFKQDGPLQFLGKSLLMVWPAALALAAVETVFFRYHFEASTGFCIANESSVGGSDPVYIALMLLSFAICLAAGVAILVAARSESSWPMFRGRSWRLALIYPLIFAVTQGLIIFMQFNWPSGQTPLLITAETLQNLNGFLNTATYFLQKFVVQRRLASAGVENHPQQPTPEQALDNLTRELSSFPSNPAMFPLEATEVSFGLHQQLQDNFVGDANDGDVELAATLAQSSQTRNWRRCWGLHWTDGVTAVGLLIVGTVVAIWIGHDAQSLVFTLVIFFLVLAFSIGYAVASVTCCHVPRADPEAEARHAAARQVILRKLPPTAVTVSGLEASSPDRRGCPICLEEFQGGEHVLPLPCFHQFHHACVEQWLQKHDMCPVCRHNIFTNSTEGYERFENEAR